jgi:hypothetical protein
VHALYVGSKIMDGLIIIGLFIGFLVIPIGGSIYILWKTDRNLRRAYVAIVLLSIPISIWLTHMRVQYNENTYAFGWPIPRVIFQRDSPDDPWLDFVGLTWIFAYPLNYLALLVPLVISYMAIIGFQNIRRRTKKISQQVAPRNR